MSTVGVRTHLASHGAAASAEVAVPPALLRLVAFVPLALFGVLHWTSLVRPAAGGGGLGTVVAASGAALVLTGLGTVRDRRVRAAACAGVVLALLIVGFRTAGIPARLLVPTAWDELASGIGQGISRMPSVTVPYRGVDEWVRVTILVGGTLLTGLAALLAFWPARGVAARPGVAPGSPLPAAVVLCVLYAVPVVEHGPQAPFLGGAVFSLLLATFLWLERLRGDQLGVATVCLVLATVAGVVIAPRLDAQRPWIDYQSLAEDLQPKAADTFDWDHRYTPLNWPRDGREVLRVKAPLSAYWKATTLDRFDGIRWRTGRLSWLMRDEAEEDGRHSEWYQTISVVVGDMATREFVTAGSALRILPPAPDADRAGPGTFIVHSGSLRRGTTYRARVYTPKPTELQFRSAPARYPDFVRDYLRMDLPQRIVRERMIDPGSIAQRPGAGATLRFPVWNDAGGPIQTTYISGYQDQRGDEFLRHSGYARVWALARRLRAESGSPYQYVQNVLERVQQGAIYSETPAPHRLPLASFLFDDRVGYCQQFSGAMALLLRMGGIPARVASGFTPGRYDRRTGTYVVRDLDAHSWVEAYFPGLGWATFDPTPAAAPARSQADDQSAAGAPDFGAASPNGDRAGDPGSPGAARAGDGTSSTVWLVVAGVLLATGLAAGGWIAVRRGRPPEPALGPELAELQRALHRTRRTPAPRTTLRALEAALGGSAAAREYLRAVRQARYGGVPAAAPTAEQRRALRTELGAGLGLRGRLRALWALPPRLPAWLRRGL